MGRFFIFYFLIIPLFSCQKKVQDMVTTASCTPVPNGILQTYSQQDSFMYTSNTLVSIDINNDNVADFQCLSRQAGNRISKLLVPVDTNNKISSTPLSMGDSVTSRTVFTNTFDFNGLGDASAAHLSNSYFGVQFKVNQCTHYGWIKFSSSTDGSPNSTTPVYYSNVFLQIHQTGFHEIPNQSIELN